MKKAIFFTAFDRIAYLQETLYTWDAVRHLQDWHFVAMIEPSPIQDQIRDEFEEFVHRAELTDYEIRINPQRYGVLHHPWVGFSQMFAHNYDFVVRAEDDLVVSDDILEYFQQVSEQYKDDQQVATAHAFTHKNGSPDEMSKQPLFSPWVWGTWRDRWEGLIGPTWDHDYSTYNGSPGEQAGWDWNLNTRIFPQNDLRSVVPEYSRVNNIGVIGIHGNIDNFTQTDAFSLHQPPRVFKDVSNDR